MLIPPGFFQATLELTLAGDVDPYNVVTMHSYDLTSFDQVEHCNAVMAAWIGRFRAEFSTAATIQRVTGRFGVDGGDPLIYESDLTPLLGTSAGAKLPQNCALLISKRSNLGGRRGRGRMYVPCLLTEANVTDTGVIATTTRNAYQTLASGLLTDWATGAAGAQPATPLHIGHTASGTGVTPPPTPVTALTVEPVIATQRRRLRR